MKPPLSLGTVLLGAFLLIGSAHTIVYPPFQVPDEQKHWVAGLQRLQLPSDSSKPICSTEIALTELFRPELVSFRTEAKLPPGLFSQAKALEPACKDIVIGYGGIFSYPQVAFSHLFHVSLSPSALHSFTFSRLIAGLMVFLALALSLGAAYRSQSTAALYTAWTAILLHLSPIGIQQSFAVSSDVTAFAFAVLLGNYLLAGRHWAKLEWTAFIGFGLSALQTKPILAPLLIPVAWLTSQATGFKNRATAIFISLSCYGLGIGLFSGALSQGGYQGDPVLQKAHILANPVEVALMLVKTAMIHTFTFNRWLLGKLGWVDHYASRSTQWSFALLVLTVIAVGAFLSWRLRSLREEKSDQRHKESTLAHFLFVGLWGASVCLIPYALYMTWTKPGADHVDGLQGRYFLPHLTLFFSYVFFLLGNRGASSVATTGEENLLQRKAAAITAILCCFYFINTTLDTLIRYY